MTRFAHSANPHLARGDPIEAPRREPGGRRAVGLFPVPGSPRNRSPPKRPIRDHHQRRLGVGPCHLAGRSVGFTSRRLGVGPCHLAGRSLGFTSRRLGVGPCHLAGRSLRASCPSLARGKPSFAILAALRFPNAGSIGTGPPLANPYSARVRNRSPPARAGGTAGRWAFPVPGSPQIAHHQLAQSACRKPDSLPTQPARRA